MQSSDFRERTSLECYWLCCKGNSELEKKECNLRLAKLLSDADQRVEKYFDNLLFFHMQAYKLEC